MRWQVVRRSQPFTMKRKRSAYKKFKLVSHDVANGSRPNNLEDHLEVRVDSRGRIRGHTTYRSGPATSSLHDGNTLAGENPPTAAPLLTDSVAASDEEHASSNGLRPSNVRDFQVAVSRPEADMSLARPDSRVAVPS